MSVYILFSSVIYVTFSRTDRQAKYTFLLAGRIHFQFKGFYGSVAVDMENPPSSNNFVDWVYNNLFRSAGVEFFCTPIHMMTVFIHVGTGLPGLNKC